MAGTIQAVIMVLAVFCCIWVSPFFYLSMCMLIISSRFLKQPIKMAMEENVNTAATPDARVHPITIGTAANAYVLVNVLSTTAWIMINVHAIATASVHHTTSWIRTTASVSVTASALDTTALIMTSVHAYLLKVHAIASVLLITSLVLTSVSVSAIVSAPMVHIWIGAGVTV